MKSFTDTAEFQIHFQPYQLYPELERGDAEGVDKREYLTRLGQARGRSAEERKSGFMKLRSAWEAEGLKLPFAEGSKMGNSFDAQRLISLARKQGREDQMIEAIYTANHEKDLCLSKWSVLLDCAKQAGVRGAEELLKGDQEVHEVVARIQSYVDLGITAVPVVVINERFPLHGSPTTELLCQVFGDIVRFGQPRRWPPEGEEAQQREPTKPPSAAPRELVDKALALVGEASDAERREWRRRFGSAEPAWDEGDPMWGLLEERIGGDASVREAMGQWGAEQRGVFRALLAREFNPRWRAALAGCGGTGGSEALSAIGAALAAARVA